MGKYRKAQKIDAVSFCLRKEADGKDSEKATSDSQVSNWHQR